MFMEIPVRSVLFHRFMFKFIGQQMLNLIPKFLLPSLGISLVAVLDIILTS